MYLLIDMGVQVFEGDMWLELLQDLHRLPFPLEGAYQLLFRSFIHSAMALGQILSTQLR